MATIRALSSYKHADHFNKRVVAKVKHETIEEKAEQQKETASVVKEIQAKKEVGIVPEVVIEKKPTFVDKPIVVEKKPVAKKPVKK
jgi:hypothetical protein